MFFGEGISTSSTQTEFVFVRKSRIEFVLCCGSCCCAVVVVVIVVVMSCSIG